MKNIRLKAISIKMLKRKHRRILVKYLDESGLWKLAIKLWSIKEILKDLVT